MCVILWFLFPFFFSHLFLNYHWLAGKVSIGWFTPFVSVPRCQTRWGRPGESLEQELARIGQFLSQWYRWKKADFMVLVGSKVFSTFFDVSKLTTILEHIRINWVSRSVWLACFDATCRQWLPTSGMIVRGSSHHSYIMAYLWTTRMIESDSDGPSVPSLILEDRLLETRAMFSMIGCSGQATNKSQQEKHVQLNVSITVHQF